MLVGKGMLITTAEGGFFVEDLNLTPKAFVLNHVKLSNGLEIRCNAERIDDIAVSTLAGERLHVTPLPDVPDETPWELAFAAGLLTFGATENEKVYKVRILNRDLFWPFRDRLLRFLEDNRTSYSLTASTKVILTLYKKSLNLPFEIDLQVVPKAAFRFRRESVEAFLRGVSCCRAAQNGEVVSIGPFDHRLSLLFTLFGLPPTVESGDMYFALPEFTHLFGKPRFRLFRSADVVPLTVLSVESKACSAFNIPRNRLVINGILVEGR